MSRLWICSRVRKAVREVTFVFCCDSRRTLIVAKSGRREQNLSRRLRHANAANLRTPILSCQHQLDTGIRLQVPRPLHPAAQFHVWCALFPDEFPAPARSGGQSAYEMEYRLLPTISDTC